MLKISLNHIVKYVKGDIITNRECKNMENISIENITTDSRNITQNSLFIPIIGEKFDAHDFIEQAFEKGAVACLSSKDITSKNGIIIKVKDTKEALKDLAYNYKSLFKIPVVAVTGSVGKTSCKEMIGCVLNQKYKVLKTKGNFNNDIGLPITIFNLEKSHEILVLEMGMNHFGEIYELCKIARPQYAVITNVGVSHIENLGSQEGILKAKSEIFSFMNQEDVGMINGDDKYLKKIKEKYNINMITYGLNHNNDYYATDIKIQGFNGLKATIHTPLNEFDVEVNSIGKHMIYNLLPAVILGERFGLTTQQIKEGIKSFSPTDRRLNVYKVNKDITIIDDVYNANPDSMKAALVTLGNLPKYGRKVAIVGDMFEMGDHSEQGHKEVGECAGDQNIDLLICIGEDAHYIKKAYDLKSNEKAIYFNNIDEAIENIELIIKEQDTILIKASRGMHFEKIIDKIKEVTK